MTRIVLIRHGETEWNVHGLYQGQLDSPLTPEGLAQAERLVRRMRRHSTLSALYASDLPRTHATAAYKKEAPQRPMPSGAFFFRMGKLGIQHHARRLDPLLLVGKSFLPNQV